MVLKGKHHHVYDNFSLFLSLLHSNDLVLKYRSLATDPLPPIDDDLQVTFPTKKRKKGK